MIIPSYFDEVTLLITHYNRPHTLERLLRTFADLQCSFKETIVTDDGSREENLQLVRSYQKEFEFTLLTSPVNKGLGNNINKGQDAVKTPYTLFMTDDCIPQAIFSEHFQDALAILKERSDIDIARFFAYFPYPYTKPFGKGFSEMIFHKAPWYTNHLKFFYYSDHPHLRRSNFFEKFGRYDEGLGGDRTEYNMTLSFIRHKAKGIFYDQHESLFQQKNTIGEPSTMGRGQWRSSKKPFFLFLRTLYLPGKFIKCNIDLLLTR